MSNQHYVTSAEFYGTLQPIRWAIRNIERRMHHMATQADIDAIAAELATVSADLDAAATTLQAEIDALAGQNVDVSGIAGRG